MAANNSVLTNECLKMEQNHKQQQYSGRFVVQEEGGDNSNVG